ncbi:RL10 [Enterospora canceri]|uniref:RL10 n=1 Tax=Enterospora canceri TaxID=1081671 RepID=A0A1Y1S4B0_9MICR|nr:RL10 [Enterospora canceri]
MSSTIEYLENKQDIDMCWSRQTGMRNSFGKPYGRAARVFVGQHIINVRTKGNFVSHAKEALRRAKNKLSGKQLIQESTIHEFTKMTRDEYQNLRSENRLLVRGSCVSVVKEKGSIEKYKERMTKALE